MDTNELAKTRTFAYDAAGNLIEKIDRLGRKTVWEYDNRYRLTNEKWYDGVTLVRTLSFAYSAANELVSASDPAATYAYSYDALSRVTSEGQTLAGLSPTLTYASTFDAASRRTELLASIGSDEDFLNTYTYDNLHRLTRLEQGSGEDNVVAEKRFDFAYNAASQVTKLARYADQSATEFVAASFYSYDGLGRLSKLTHNESDTPAGGWGNDPLAGYAFTYDVASRITSIDSYIDGLTEYDYDNTSQLVGADHTGISDETYAYDENGNRTMGGYSIGDNNQLLSDGTYNYAYDDEGNRLTKVKISNSDKEELTWDHRNRLTNVKFKNSGGTVTKAVDFFYDAFDRLIRRTIDPDGATGSAALLDSFFSWENDQINLQFDGDDASDLAHRNLYSAAIDHILAVENVASLASAGEVVWPLSDHLGTPRDLASYDSGTNETTIENHRIFNSFGKLVSETNGSFTINIGFTGAIFEAAIGYNYHRARWLDLNTGRWVSEDPKGIGAGDPNFVRFVLNLPTSLTDPSGLKPPLSDQLIHAADVVLVPPPLKLFRRWIYTGGLFPSNQEVESAKAGAGECYNQTKANAHSALDVISTVDPSPLTDGVQTSLYVLEEDYDNAKKTAVTGATGPVGDLLKAGKIVGVIGKHGDEVAGIVAKQGDDVAGAVAKQGDKVAESVPKSGSFVDEMSECEAARYREYWGGKHDVSSGQPFGVKKTVTKEGELKTVTTFDEHGRPHRQYGLNEGEAPHEHGFTYPQAPLPGTGSTPIRGPQKPIGSNE